MVGFGAEAVVFFTAQASVIIRAANAALHVVVTHEALQAHSMQSIALLTDTFTLIVVELEVSIFIASRTAVSVAIQTANPTPLASLVHLEVSCDACTFSLEHRPMILS